MKNIYWTKKIKKLFIQLPAITLGAMLGVLSQPVNAFPINAKNQDYLPNDLNVLITPDFYPVIFYDIDKYGIKPEVTGASVCNSSTCSGTALNAGSVKYKFYSTTKDGWIVFYFDNSNDVIGYGLDLDRDSYGNLQDNDIDGDGVLNFNDDFDYDATEWSDNNGNGIGDNTDIATGNLFNTDNPGNDVDTVLAMAESNVDDLANAIDQNPAESRTSSNGLVVEDSVVNKPFGALSGQFSVSQNGAASYSLPLKVVPGIAGMEPKLSVEISSQGGSAWLGQGASLSGFSSVARCPTNITEDGRIDGVDFDSNDAWCLDGQRLLKQSTGVYKTRVDNFSRITSQGDQYNPTSFTVETKAGETWSYTKLIKPRLASHSSDYNSKVWYTSAPYAITYLLEKIEDNSGNSIEFNYYDSGRGTYRPTLINYTKNGLVDSQGQIKFDYTYHSANTYTNYIGGYQVDSQTKNTIKTITVSSYANDVRQYKFDYDYGYNNQQPILKQIKECSLINGEQCKPALKLGWYYDTVKEHKESLGYGTSGYTKPSRSFVMDFNSDGYTDIMYLEDSSDHFKAHLRKNTGSGFTYHQNFITNSNVEGYKDDNINRVKVGDLNGDTVPDFLLLGSVRKWINNSSCPVQKYSVKALMSNGINGYYSQAITLKSFEVRGSYNNTSSGGCNYYVDHFSPVNFRLIDADGDGQSDLVWLNRVWLTQGFGNNVFLQEKVGAGINLKISYETSNNGTADYIKQGDFNGDGLQDFYVVEGDASYTRDSIYLSDGDGTFTLKYRVGPSTYGHVGAYRYAPHHMNRIQITDINNDGLSDVTVLPLFETGDMNVSYYLSRGNGTFSSPQNITGYSTSIPSKKYRDTWLNRTRFGDFNGDGYTDIHHVGINNVNPANKNYFFFGNGKGHFTKGYKVNVTVSDKRDERMADLAAVKYADFNGDGLMDVVRLLDHSEPSSYFSMHLSQRITPQLRQIANSVDTNIKIDYERLNKKGSSSVYTRNFSATGNYMSIISPMQVVSKVYRLNGIGRRDITSYSYRDFMVHKFGYGMQGFKQLISKDERNNITTNNVFYTEFPYSGMLANKYELLDSPLAYISSVTNTRFASGGLSTGGGSKFPYFSTSTETSYLYDNVISAASRKQSVKKTTQTYDIYGNITSMAIEHTGDGDDYKITTTNAYGEEYANEYTINPPSVIAVPKEQTFANEQFAIVNTNYSDNKNIITSQMKSAYIEALRLGRLTSSSVTKTNLTTGVTITRTANFSYYDDGLGMLHKETVAAGLGSQLEKTTVHEYDGFGNEIKTITCAAAMANCSASHPSARILQTDYSAPSDQSYVSGQFLYQTSNALGHTEQNIYDPRFGVVTKLTGPNNLDTVWEYDEFGRVVNEVRADGAASKTEREWCLGGICNNVPGLGSETVAPLYKVTSYTGTTTELATDNFGLEPAISYHDRLGRTIRKESNGPGGKIYVDSVFDLSGRNVKTSSPYYVGDTVYWTLGVFDALGRQYVSLTPDVDETNAYSYAVSLTSYNTDIHNTGIAGYATTGTDSLGRSSSKITDVMGQTIATVDANGQIMRYEYDTEGNLHKTTDPANNSIVINYDAYGRKVNMNDPDMGFWQYEYNAFGELTQQTDAKGVATTMAYDKLGRLTHRQDNDNNSDATDNSTATPAATWAYDSASGKGIGKLHTVQGQGENKVYTYNNYGQLSHTTYNLGMGQSYNVSQSYDSYSRVNTITYPSTRDSSLIVQNQYHPQYGYLQAVKNIDNTHSDHGKTYWQVNPDAPLSHNAHGAILSAQYGNGLKENYSYLDTHNWLRQTLTYNATTNIQNLHMAFDEVGNLSSRTDYMKGGLKEEFTYDNLDRLLTASIDPTTQVSGGNYNNHSTNYDVLGNITDKHDMGSYQYGNACSTSYQAGPHAVCQINNTDGTTKYHYEYDANGNQIRQYNASGQVLRTVAYSYFNKPEVINANNNNIVFSYNADRSRYKQVASDGTNTATTLYVGLGKSGGNLFEAISNSNGEAQYNYFIYANGKMVSTHSVLNQSGTLSNTTDYHHHDHLGSVVMTTDATGAIKSANSFDSWGKTRNSDNWGDAPAGTSIAVSNTGRLGFTGHETLNAVGLIHMNGRVYDPQLARFISPDPHVQFEADLQNYNRYSYVSNNPLRYSDPTGYFLDSIVKELGRALQQIVPIVIAIQCPMCAAAMSAHQAYAAGASFGDALKIIAVAYLTAQAHGVVSGIGIGWENTFYNGLVGGASSAALGGSFSDGFNGAFFSAAFKMTGLTDKNNPETPFNSNGRKIVAAMVGGTASKLSGGKFANGAISGAMAQIYNGEFTHEEKEAFLQGLKDQAATLAEYYSNLEGENLNIVFGNESPSLLRDIRVDQFNSFRKFQNMKQIFVHIRDMPTDIAQHLLTAGATKALKGGSLLRRFLSSYASEKANNFSVQVSINVQHTPNISCEVAYGNCYIGVFNDNHRYIIGEINSFGQTSFRK